MSKGRNTQNNELFEPENYSYSVSWSDADQVFVGRVAEFGSLSAHGDTQAAALKEITEVVRFVLQDLAESNEPIPEPFSKKQFSGKFLVRTTSSLHRSLALEAVRQGVSLNSLINQKLCKI